MEDFERLFAVNVRGPFFLVQQLLPLMPHAPESWLVESVLSGDKRASAQAFLGARGRNASAEIVLKSAR